MTLTKEQKIVATIIQKAWDDATFKRELFKNPRITIENFIGKKMNVPKNKILVVCDQMDPEKIYLNIPSQTNMEDVELNEEQLDSVAGGGELIDPVLTGSGIALQGLFGE